MKCVIENHGKQGKIEIRRGLYILFQIKIQGQNFVPYERARPMIPCDRENPKEVF